MDLKLCIKQNRAEIADGHYQRGPVLAIEKDNLSPKESSSYLFIVLEAAIYPIFVFWLIQALYRHHP